MAPKKKRGAGSGGGGELSDAQQAAQAKSQLLASRAEDIGVLSCAKPDQYPKLAPSKGASSTQTMNAVRRSADLSIAWISPWRAAAAAAAVPSYDPPAHATNC